MTDQMREELPALTMQLHELPEWIERTIETLEDPVFANAYSKQDIANALRHMLNALEEGRRAPKPVEVTDVDKRDEELKDIERVLNDHAAIIRKYGTCPAMAIEVQANRIAAIRKAGEATDSEKWIRAWRNRFISERTEKYRADGDGYELSRAQAEDDANNYENSLRTAMREAGEGEKG